MNLYRTHPSSSFLDILADFILKNFDNIESMSNLRIILPNGLACLNLQKILINKQNIAILPNIIPFSNIIAEGEEIFKLSSENLETTTFLQEKIILAEIINDYPELKFNITQSLQCCSSIAELFYQLASNNLSLDLVNQIEQTRSKSQYWQSVYHFLNFVYQRWQKKIISLGKQDKVNYQKKMLQAEIDRLNNDGNSLIIAAILGQDYLSWNFLGDIANSKSAYIILPPIGDIADDQLKPDLLAEEDCFYSLKQLLKTLNKNLSDFQILGDLHQQHIILDRLIINNQEDYRSNKYPQTINHIKYIELEDIFQEAQQISLICQQHNDQKIAIIIDSLTIKNFYCNFLIKDGLEFQDLLGNDLSKTAISSLIIAISEIRCNDFEIKKLFLLLKNPLINCELVEKLQLLMSGSNRFIINPSQILTLIEKTSNSELIEWGEKLINLLYKNCDNNFLAILKSVVRIAEVLYPDIWHQQSAKELANFLGELIKFNTQLTLNNKSNFPEILKSLISDYKYYDHNIYSKNIMIGKAEDLILLKFDLVILANFNQINGESSSAISKWVNERTLRKLNINSSKIKSSIARYYFYLFLHNSKVVITRAKRQDGKSSSLSSNLLLKLQFILGKNLTVQSDLLASNSAIQVKSEIIDDKISSPIFPSILSVTDIEMLVRNPYSFYAKKILNLRSKDMVGEEPKISEFGNFIHRALEQYSKNYDQLINHKVETILNISNNILENVILPPYTKKIWQTKFVAIAQPFINFDEKRRRGCKYVYSERKGEILLNIAGQDLKITGVADRIEVDNLGRAIIIDYKTGTLPSRKDVVSGLSPQLIIEALMLQQGGFEIKVDNIKQLIYVKISSSEPYIQTLEIDLTKENLQYHKQAMVTLLKYYITNKSFVYNIDLLKYNDYKHLARMI